MSSTIIINHQANKKEHACIRLLHSIRSNDSLFQFFFSFIQPAAPACFRLPPHFRSSSLSRDADRLHLLQKKKNERRPPLCAPIRIASQWSPLYGTVKCDEAWESKTDRQTSPSHETPLPSSTRRPVARGCPDFKLTRSEPPAFNLTRNSSRESKYWIKTWFYLSFLEGIRKLTLKFWGSTAGLIGDSSPLLGWIRWAWTRSRGIAKLQCALLICESFGISRLICEAFGITRLIRASFGITRLMCKGTARGRPRKGKKDA
ncbi:hypothetical protein E5676_scaffold208G00400 [Cucumis melo var. makuwa]|uniref:Uncharacterized protein n=1 Tax=Cucumis melo var. makuwa TaxID=1194695 RepID=A0A5D3E1S1_CUCMM|nr:hypothetical protein E5676_scaffold208G00400 [Cucumis melo var. makuwa]